MQQGQPRVARGEWSRSTSWIDLAVKVGGRGGGREEESVMVLLRELGGGG